MNINKKYAIRKLTVGIASVSIGLFVCNSVNIENPISTKTQNVAKAEETTNWQPQGNIVAQGVDGVVGNYMKMVICYLNHITGIK